MNETYPLVFGYPCGVCHSSDRLSFDGAVNITCTTLRFKSRHQYQADCSATFAISWNGIPKYNHLRINESTRLMKSIY